MKRFRTPRQWGHPYRQGAAAGVQQSSIKRATTRRKGWLLLAGLVVAGCSDFNPTSAFGVSADPVRFCSIARLFSNENPHAVIREAQDFTPAFVKAVFDKLDKDSAAMAEVAPPAIRQTATLYHESMHLNDTVIGKKYAYDWNSFLSDPDAAADLQIAKYGAAYTDIASYAAEECQIGDWFNG
jgi:hypothetical protein